MAGTARPRSAGQSGGQSTVRVVFVRVVGYFSDRGFGFAEIIGETSGPTKVFFRIEKLCIVTGSYEEPKFADPHPNPAEINPLQIEAGRQVVMEVESTTKGLRARRWGIAPVFSPITQLIREKVLDGFIGGHVGIYQNGRRFVAYPKGTFTGYELTESELTVYFTWEDFGDSVLEGYQDHRQYYFTGPAWRLGFGGLLELHPSDHSDELIMFWPPDQK